MNTVTKIHHSTIGDRTRTHGMSDGPEHLAWMRMRQRANNVNHPDYVRYGGNGINVCEGWNTRFESFYADLGGRPSPIHSIDRTNNLGGYWCGHCDECITNGWPRNGRWATPTEQARNRSSNRPLTVNGETMLLMDWAAKVGINRTTLARRLDRGWSHERAVLTPARYLKPGRWL